MEESASIVLDYKDIENILFDYYFGLYTPEAKKQVDETGKMLCNIKTKKGLLKTERSYNFILMYEKPIKSLEHSMTVKKDVTLTDLWNIINEKISDNGYEIDEVDDNLIYGLQESSSDRLNFLTFHLKKKEKVKTKKKGRK